MTSPRRRSTPQPIVPVLNRAGKGREHMDDYVVTIRQDQHYNVKARSPEHASARALEEQRHRWGAGHCPEVTEVEKL